MTISRTRSTSVWCRLVGVVAAAALVMAPQMRVVLHAADGDLDATFGTGGQVLVDALGSAVTVAVQADGKIVVAQPFAAEDFRVARYNADGSRDVSFGVGGVASVDLPDVTGNANVVAIQGDGKIVAAGSVISSTGTSDFGLVRFNTDGSLDTAFGSGGLVTTDLGAASIEGVQALAILEDGRIVAAGRSGDPANVNAAIARYHPDGTLDTTFDGDGWTVTDINGVNNEVRSIAIQPDGKIVAAGSVAPSFVNVAFAVIRYNTDGSLDTTFDADGIVITQVAPVAIGGGKSVALQVDGKIVVAGEIGNGLALVRYQADGSLDPSFDGDGILVSSATETLQFVAGMAIQPDGRIVIAGSRPVTLPSGPPPSQDWVVVRYDPTGTLDTTFGIGGVVVTDFAGRFDTASAMALQIDGKIVVVGDSRPAIFGGGSQAALARYDGATPHDIAFFLHAHDIPGTADGFTMDQTAPSSPRFVRLDPSRPVSWFSDPPVNGAFLATASFTLTTPCQLGLNLPRTVTLSTTDLNGANEHVLATASNGVSLCTGPTTLTIPVATPVVVHERRLKLSVTSHVPFPVVLRLGSETFLGATTLVGIP